MKLGEARSWVGVRRGFDMELEAGGLFAEDVRVRMKEGPATRSTSCAGSLWRS